MENSGLYSKYDGENTKTSFLEEDEKTLNWVKNTAKTAVEQSQLTPDLVIDGVKEVLERRDER